MSGTMFASYQVTAVVGYEIHDEYVTTGTQVVVVPGSVDVYNMATAEAAAFDLLIPERDYNGWCRIESIVRVDPA